MEVIIKTYAGLFILVLMLFVGINIVSADIKTSQATDFNNACISQIEESNYSQTVIDSCKKAATDNGYESLDVTVIKNEDGEPLMAEVITTYKYVVSLYGLNKTHEVRGYAK